jgi:hypothetical protein
VLVDLDEAVVRGAERELHAGRKTGFAADLSQQPDLDRIREAVLGASASADRVITCFEVVEHLEDFAPLVGLLVELAESAEATSVLSVPNDAFWAIENPHHRAMWGEGSCAELLSLLPASRATGRQVSLNGSALFLDAERCPRPEAAELRALDDTGIPTHFIFAIGPRCTELACGALVAQTDLAEQRRWERQRESDNAYFQVALAASQAETQAALTAARDDIERLIAERDELARVVGANTTDFDAWRACIHDLEGRLGLPPSGSPERLAFDAGQGAERPRGELPAGGDPPAGADPPAAAETLGSQVPPS